MAAMGCCAFLPRAASGYHALDSHYGGDAVITVVVGKERQAFEMSPRLLRSDPFRILMKVIGKKKKVLFSRRDRDVIVTEDVDSILFEHLIWLAVNNECPPELRRHLKEIIDFYAHDF